MRALELKVGFVAAVKTSQKFGRARWWPSKVERLKTIIISDTWGIRGMY